MNSQPVFGNIEERSPTVSRTVRALAAVAAAKLTAMTGWVPDSRPSALSRAFGFALGQPCGFAQRKAMRGGDAFGGRERGLPFAGEGGGIGDFQQLAEA